MNEGRENEISSQGLRSSSSVGDDLGLNKVIFDVCIVGASVPGSACAYYLAEGGLTVLLLERQYFDNLPNYGVLAPRRAQKILKQMGLFDEIIAENIASPVIRSGFVSPEGRKFIGLTRAERTFTFFVQFFCLLPFTFLFFLVHRTIHYSSLLFNFFFFPFFFLLRICRSFLSFLFSLGEYSPVFLKLFSISSLSPSPPSSTPISSPPKGSSPRSSSSSQAPEPITTSSLPSLSSLLSRPSSTPTLRRSSFVEGSLSSRSSFSGDDGVLAARPQQPFHSSSSSCSISSSISSSSKLDSPFLQNNPSASNSSDNLSDPDIQFPEEQQTHRSSGSSQKDHSLWVISKNLLKKKICLRAWEKGAVILESAEVNEVEFSMEKNCWIINCSEPPIGGERWTEEREETQYMASMLIGADGPQSKIFECLLSNIDSRKYQKWSSSRAIAYSCYVEIQNHQLERESVDMLYFFPREMLPGFIQIYKQPATSMLTAHCYLPEVRSLSQLDINMTLKRSLTTDQILDFIGHEARIETRKKSPLFTGGSLLSCDDRLLVIGLAAAMADCTSGASLLYGLKSGQVASRSVLEGFQKRDLSREHFIGTYQTRLDDLFRVDLYLSRAFATLSSTYPQIIEAVCDFFLHSYFTNLYWPQFVQVATGERSKVWFLRPWIMFGVIYEILKLYLSNLISSPTTRPVPLVSRRTFSH